MMKKKRLSLTSSAVSSVMLTFTHTHYYLAADEDEEEEEEEEEEEGTGPPTGLKEGRNSQLSVGYKGDRSYVVRGDKIGVFRHKADEVEYVASIANITDMKGKKFDPKNVSLALYSPSSTR
jgi:hypothetical protein